MHKFMGSLFPLHQSLAIIRFCREMKQNAMIRVAIEKFLGYMYVVNLTSKSKFPFFRELLFLSISFVSSIHCTVN